MNTLGQLRTESLSIIVRLAPTPVTFRATQLANIGMHVASAEQYHARARFRRLNVYKDKYLQSYSYMLPGNNYDGLRVILYDDGDYTLMYRIRDKYYGKYVQYDNPGILRERCEYRFASKREHPTRKWCYDCRGKLTSDDEPFSIWRTSRPYRLGLRMDGIGV